MIGTRLAIACADAGLTLPDEGRIAVWLPPSGADLAALNSVRCDVIVDFKPDFDAWTARGFRALTEAEGRYAAAIVCLPRAKPQARAVIAAAMALTDGPVVIDGQKTDGADSLLREMRRRAGVDGLVSKAHGKLFWCAAQPEAFDDWAQGPTRNAAGAWTAPGVFSADGPDPASIALAEMLPDDLGAAVADFGAGWGFLSAHVLTREAVKTVHLVEAGHMALECARRNVTDQRACFHWADATRWLPDTPLDTVVMNPPFHVSRAADPALGQAFIAAAARALHPRGSLWMVANRHLPYEESLGTAFGQVTLSAEDNRFKLFNASRPTRAKR